MNREDTNHTHTHQGSGTNISSLLFGMVLGAFLTYLFANKEGQKVKNQLLREGVRLLDEVSARVRELGEKTENLSEDLKEELEDKIEQVPEHIEKIQKKGRRFFFRRSASHES